MSGRTPDIPVPAAVNVSVPSIPLARSSHFNPTAPHQDWALRLVAHVHDALRLELRNLFRALRALADRERLKPAHMRCLFAWFDTFEALTVTALKAEEETIFPWIEQWGRVDGPLCTARRITVKGSIIRSIRDAAACSAMLDTATRSQTFRCYTSSENTSGDTGSSPRPSTFATAKNHPNFHSSSSPLPGSHHFISRNEHGPKPQSSLTRRFLSYKTARKAHVPSSKKPSGLSMKRKCLGMFRRDARTAFSAPADTDSVSSSASFPASGLVPTRSTPGSPNDSRSYYRPLHASIDADIRLQRTVISKDRPASHSPQNSPSLQDVLKSFVRHVQIMSRSLLSYFDIQERYLPAVIEGLYDFEDIHACGIERRIFRSLCKSGRKDEAVVIMVRACLTKPEERAWITVALTKLDRLALPIWRRRFTNGRDALLETLVGSSASQSPAPGSPSSPHHMSTGPALSYHSSCRNPKTPISLVSSRQEHANNKLLSFEKPLLKVAVSSTTANSAQPRQVRLTDSQSRIALNSRALLYENCSHIDHETVGPKSTVWSSQAEHNLYQAKERWSDDESRSGQLRFPLSSKNSQIASSSALALATPPSSPMDMPSSHSMSLSWMRLHDLGSKVADAPSSSTSSQKDIAEQDTLSSSSMYEDVENDYDPPLRLSGMHANV